MGRLKFPILVTTVLLLSFTRISLFFPTGTYVVYENCFIFQSINYFAKFFDTGYSQSLIKDDWLTNWNFTARRMWELNFCQTNIQKVLKISTYKLEFIRKVSSMIHLARPTVPPEVISFFAIFNVLYMYYSIALSWDILKSKRKFGRTTCMKIEITTVVGLMNQNVLKYLQVMSS